MEKERKQRITAMKEQVNKKYGKGFIGNASQMLVKSISRIPCGNIAVDMGVGGGFPVGRVTMLFGDKSSGKTTTMLGWIAEAQQICSSCYQYRTAVVDEKTGEVKKYTCDCKKGYREFVVALMDTEGAYDRAWGGIHGVDNDTLIYSAPEYAEQCIDIVDAWLRSGDVDAICIDSLAHMVPSEEVEKSTEEWQQGLQARLLNKGCRKWGSALNYSGKKFGRRPTLILINQLRMKIGVQFGNPETKPGGKGQEFLTSIEVKFWSGKVEVEDKTKTPLWAVKRYKVEKNKVSPVGKSGEFSIVLSDTETKKIGDVMDEEYVFGEMNRFGLLKYEREGGNIILIGDARLNGKGQVARYWMLNPEEYEEAKELLLQYALK